jgi:hypothetical protein
VSIAGVVKPNQSCEFRKSFPFKVNRNNLKDPYLIENFRTELWKFRHPVGVPHDRLLEKWIKFVKKKAVAVFGRAQTAPRQPWISPSTMLLVRTTAPLRRVTSHLYTFKRRLSAALVWFAWRSLLHDIFVPDEPAIQYDVKAQGWKALAIYHEIRSFFATVMRWIQCCRRSSSVLHCVISRCCKLDRNDFLQHMAWRAQDASTKNNFQESYKIVRLLQGYTPKQIKSVKLLNGQLTCNEQARQLRWQEHFCGVFDGYITKLTSDITTAPHSVSTSSLFKPSLADW